MTGAGTSRRGRGRNSHPAAQSLRGPWPVALSVDGLNTIDARDDATTRKWVGPCRPSLSAVGNESGEAPLRITTETLPGQALGKTANCDLGCLLRERASPSETSNGYSGTPGTAAPLAVPRARPAGGWCGCGARRIRRHRHGPADGHEVVQVGWTSKVRRRGRWISATVSPASSRARDILPSQPVTSASCEARGLSGLLPYAALRRVLNAGCRQAASRSAAVTPARTGARAAARFASSPARGAQVMGKVGIDRLG